MARDNDINTIVEYCKSNLDLAKANFDDEDEYQNLPLCIIDAIFSLGARYTSTENTVRQA